jgi:acyl-coenzyme A synthetase/AMP-(fatty) acid ligase
MHHEKVALASVIGVDEEGLVKTKAFVVLRSGVDKSIDKIEALALELQDHVKARLAKYKYPRAVEFVDDLPRNDRGKVDRKLLKAREAAKSASVRNLGVARPSSVPPPPQDDPRGRDA